MGSGWKPQEFTAYGWQFLPTGECLKQSEETLALSTVRRNYAASCNGGGAPNFASSFVLVYVHGIGLGWRLSSAK